MNRRRARPLLGTLVDIALTDLGPRTDAAHAFDSAFAAVERVHRLMSAHDAQSDVSRINLSRPGQTVNIDTWTYAVIEAALEVARLTGGVFDPCVAPFLQQAGLLPVFTDRGAASKADYRALRLLGECRIRKLAPLQLSLCGIAKGFAVDRATEALRAAGVMGGVVNAGGDLRAFGAAAHPIHVRHPACAGQLVFAGHLREASLATSGGSLSRMTCGEQELPHIFDPRTGSPVMDNVGASVVASKCMLADALAKAVLIDREGARSALARYRATPIVLDDETLRKAA